MTTVALVDTAVVLAVLGGLYGWWWATDRLEDRRLRRARDTVVPADPAAQRAAWQLSEMPWHGELP